MIVNDALHKLVTDVCQSSDETLESNLAVLVNQIQQIEVNESDKKIPDQLYIFKDLFKHYLSDASVKRDKHQLKVFAKVLTFMDVKYVTLHWLAETIAEADSTAVRANIFELLVALPPPLPENHSYLLDYSANPKLTEFGLKFNKLRRIYSEVWLAFVRCKVTAEVHKRLLLFLPDSVMPHMHKPVLLTDFLIHSYQKGDTYSLLGLNGLYVLMQKYNLDYPDFYNNLYSLMNGCIFSVPYKAKFFQLLDMFLSSTHLPAYLPAAFAKRLCRLCLTAPTDVVMSVLSLVKNLLARHKAIEVLVDRNDSGELSSDPYDELATDTAKCRAIESSLWELKTLQQHFYPPVAQLATQMCRSRQETEDIFSVATADEVFESEMKDIGDEDDVALSFVVPECLFKSVTTRLDTFITN